MATTPASSLPRVTSVLGAVGLAPDLSGIDPAVLERARWRGSRLHELIEAHIYGFLDESEIEPEVRPYFDGYLEFREDTGFKPLVSEVEVRSRRWGFIGHADAVGWMGPDRVLPDWKSTAVLDIDYVSYQLAAYKTAWDEMHPDQPIKRLVAVQFKREGKKKYRIHEVGKEKEGPSLAEATTVWQASMVVFRAQERRR